MDWIMLVIAFILGAISIFILVCIGYVAKQKKPRNRVHFYVARDKIGELRLYLGKPDRGDTEFYCSSGKKGMCLTYRLNNFELKDEDFDNLKWEDEPVEVFINMED